MLMAVASAGAREAGLTAALASKGRALLRQEAAQAPAPPAKPPPPAPQANQAPLVGFTFSRPPGNFD